MPRRTLPPRLYLRERRKREPVWVILDQGGEVSTGAGAGDRRGAEEALARYLGTKHRPDFGQGHPTEVAIADVLIEYGTRHAPSTRRPDLIGGAIIKLEEFFGARTVATITAAACGEYVAWRILQADARSKVATRTVKASTARRELVVLGAALTWCWRENRLDRQIPIALPDQAEPRERHLTRSEAARILIGALGWGPDSRRNPLRINRHLARFILIGLYTGTRHDAMLRLQWMPNTLGGWIDIEAGVLYRRPAGAVDSAKRRPPIPLPPRLMPHLRRWRGLTARFAIEWHGLPIASQERRAWHSARQMAGLGPDVTPHVLRHTCATWMLQAGVSVYDVAGILGTSENVIRRTYGHHAHDHLREAVAVFSGPKLRPGNGGTNAVKHGRTR